MAAYGRLEWSPRVADSVVIGMQHRRGSAVGFIAAALTILAYLLGNSPSHKSGETNWVRLYDGKEFTVCLSQKAL